MRRFFALSLLCLAAAAGACERGGSAPVSTSPDASGPIAYAGYVLPATTGEWGLAEYAQVRDTLVAIERERPDALPTLVGARGEVLARFVDLDGIDRAFAATPDVEAMLTLGEAIAQTYKLYAGRVIQGQPFGPEYLALTLALLHAGTIQFTRLAASFDEATLRADEVRLDGLLGMRYGYAAIYLGVLESPLVSPNIIDPDAAVTQLGRLTDEIGPFLLDIELRTADVMLERLSAAGADASRVAAVRSGLKSVRLHPLLAAFEPECEAYSAHQREVMAGVAEQQLLAVHVGPESGGVRWAFPEVGFSAVFHQQPNAMISTEMSEDGVPLTMRVLGIRDATGYATVIVCLSRPSPLPGGGDFARTALGDATDVRELDIDGHPGLSGERSTASSRAQVRTVELGHGGCSMIVEYPTRLEATYRDQGRAFLDSVRFGSFGGA